MKIIYAAVTALGIATLVNELTQTVCAQLSPDKTSLIVQMAPGGFYNRGGGGFNPGGNFYNRGGGFNQGNFYNRGGGGFNQGNFYNQGPDRFSQQNYRREIQELTQVIHKNPNLVEAYNNRALARFVLGDKQGAIADLKQAASLYLKRGNRAKYQQTLLSIRELQY